MFVYLPPSQAHLHFWDKHKHLPMDTKPNIYLVSQYTSELAVSLKAKKITPDMGNYISLIIQILCFHRKYDRKHNW